MNALPKGWVVVPINKITTKPEQKIPTDNEVFSYIDIGSVDRGTKTITEPQKLLGKDAPSRARQLVNLGDVLVSMTRPNLNAVALVPHSLDGQIASTGFDVLRAMEIEPRYLFASVRTKDFVDSMSELVQGALYPAVRPRDIREYEIPLAPLAEQKRIADKLDMLLARIESTHTKLDKIPELLKRFRKSVFAAATSGALTEEWRGGGETGWDEITFGNICESSFYGPRFGKDEYTSRADGIPTIRTTDMTDDGGIEISEGTPRIIVPADKLEKFAAKAGDLLVTRTGSIGVMALFDGSYVAVPSAYLIRFRFKKTILPRYAFYCLMAPDGQSAMGLSTTAITQPNINAESIKAISIGLPSIEEQREIVRRVESLLAIADRIQKQHTVAKKKVGRLTPALLAKAFRGELVPQNPSDEPADKLLQRLRSGKKEGKQPAAKRGRKAKAAL